MGDGGAAPREPRGEMELGSMWQGGGGAAPQRGAMELGGVWRGRAPGPSGAPGLERGTAAAVATFGCEEALLELAEAPEGHSDGGSYHRLG